MPNLLIASISLFKGADVVLLQVKFGIVKEIGQFKFIRSTLPKWSVLSVANLTAWCSGPRGCASTRDVLLLDAVQLCAGVPAQSTVRRDDDEVRVEDGLNVAPILRSTPNQTIVAERGTDLDRQVHGLSYKAV
ncbi:unnamed protein product [Prunus armeniaca]